MKQAPKGRKRSMETVRTVSNRSIPSSIRANYQWALNEIQEQARNLRQEIDEAAQSPDAPHTAGRIVGLAARLEAARERAAALRQAIDALSR